MLCCWHAARSTGVEPAAPWGTAAPCCAPACPNMLEMPGTATGSRAVTWPHGRAGESRAEGTRSWLRGRIPARPSWREQIQHRKHRAQQLELHALPLSSPLETPGPTSVERGEQQESPGNRWIAYPTAAQCCALLARSARSFAAQLC